MVPSKGFDRLAAAAVLPPGAFRLVLALVVLVSHVSRFDVGRLAVLLFFYLSGFWVSRIWTGEFESRHWAPFYASRWLRIAPLYLIVLAAAAMLRHLPIGLENILLIGVDTTHNDPTGVAWSLDMELQFYLLLPLLFLAPRALWPLGAVCLGAAGWACHFATGVNTVLMYLPAFAAGMATAGARWNPGPRAAMASLAGFLAFTIAAGAVPFTREFLDKRLADPFDVDLFGMVWAAPLIPYVAASLARPSAPIDRGMGNWSYPLYLVHYPLIAVMVDHGHSKWLGVAIAVPMALVLFSGPDRMFERFRRGIIGRLWRTGYAAG